MIKNLSPYIYFPILLCMMISAASPVLACSPSEDAMSLTLEDRVSNAPMILIGTVTQGFTESYGGGYEVIREVEVEVERYLKGEGPTIVRIEGFGDGADCLSIINEGQRSVFFVEGNPDETLDAVYLGVHDATWNANEENIDTIIALTGENNAPYPLPLTTQLMRFLMQPMVWWLAAGVVILLSLLILGMRFRSPRKSKAKRS